MQIVSDAVMQLLDSHAKVTLAVYIDGERLNVGVGAGSYTGACAGDDEFSFGNACAAGASVSLAVSRPDLKGRRIQIAWAVNGTEYPLLTGRVEKAKVAAGRTEVEAWDDMYFAGSDAFTITFAVAGTCTAAAAFSAVADAMGVSADSAALTLLAGITIPDGLSDLGSDVTNSAVAGYIAGLVGGNALMNRAGLLTIRQYKAVDWETEPYSGGASAENEDFTVTGITLQREKAASTLNDDGSTTERADTEEYSAGDGSLMASNPLASQAAADSAFKALSAVTVRPGDYSFPGGLLLEPGDIFTIHSMDGSYAVAVGSISMSFDGGVRSSVACGGAAEGSGGSKGAINQALVALLADYAKFKKLVADNAQINSANIVELIAGDIIANRIVTGVIRSAVLDEEGEGVGINLDTGLIRIITRDTEGEYWGDFTAAGTTHFGPDDVYRRQAHTGEREISLICIDANTWRTHGVIIRPDKDRAHLYLYKDDGAKAQIIVDDEQAQLALSGAEGNYLQMMAGPDRNYIAGLTAPVNGGDAANKAYVDGRLNRNYLDNWYFPNAVNQRGAESYWREGFTVDRWKLSLWPSSTTGAYAYPNKSDLTLHSETAQGTACSCYLEQVVDEPARLAGKTVTFSAKLRGVTVAGDPILRIYTDKGVYKSDYIRTTDANSIVTLTATLPTGITSLAVGIGNYASYGGDGSFNIAIESMKLEIGSVSTLAYDQPPDKTAQLLECQRYFVRFSNTGQTQFLSGACNGTACYGTLLLPVPLNGTASEVKVTGSGVNLYPFVPSGNVAVNSVTGYAGGSRNWVVIQANYTATETLPAQTPANIRIAAGGYIEVFADLEI